MRGQLGTTDRKAKFKQMFSNNRAVNLLAAARIFLFASRDVWFVVGLPVFLRTELGWSFWQVGTFLAVWVIGYGIVQATAPRFTKNPDGRTAAQLAFVLAAFPAGIAIALGADADPTVVIVVGLIAFGVIFALNSAVHSYLILAYAQGDKVAMNVGFYYMANAGGRLAGHRAFGRALPVARARGLPVGIGGVRARGRRVVVAAAEDPAEPRCRGAQVSATSTSSTVLRAVRPTPISVADANPVQPP